MDHTRSIASDPELYTKESKVVATFPIKRLLLATLAPSPRHTGSPLATSALVAKHRIVNRDVDTPRISLSTYHTMQIITFMSIFAIPNL
jgi:hypothetical protein